MGELLAQISSRELSEWQALYEIEAEDADRRELARKAESGLNARLAQKGR